MSERSIRVNELILRELSQILRTRFRDQTVAITLTEVSVSPDLRSGRVYYSVIGDERAKIKARSFFTKEYRNLRQLVAQSVVLKYFPKLNFVEDESIARGNRVLDLLGEIDGHNALPADAYDADQDDDYGTVADEATGEAYDFDEDDMEYARDIQGAPATDDEAFEAFDEENDIEYEGDLDDLDDDSEADFDDDADGDGESAGRG